MLAVIALLQQKSETSTKRAQFQQKSSRRSLDASAHSVDTSQGSWLFFVVSMGWFPLYRFTI